MKLLIIEDNTQIVDVLNRYLKEAGYETDVVYDGKDALPYFDSHPVDFILLDIMLPHVNGFEICQQIREKSTVPIIMITAKSEDADRILGLEVGADDYIIKPFSPKEVLYRIKAIMRRIDFEKESMIKQLTLGSMRLLLENRQAVVQDKELKLTKKEFELLVLFAKYPNKVFTRDNLLDTVWGYDYYGDSRTVDSHIKRLRAKLKKAGVSDWQIETVWGEGYRIEEST
ncbi:MULTISPECIES: response regulator transcription factor [Enterococcus]|uniref:Response regulator transcription factor n=1 Tax=Candidatus Enterococcus murrayae TaxID=2815321 RepID=A0ABS3HFZ6_9ENTE|nr:response regulator transcription factor [Enterococcus sp. MJM16]MBO0452383.1 response regulator transcription factor [Enterococcus sp. MJM16]